jgi:hypothetical protein
MRGLALCLIAGALLAAGCGSNDGAANAPQAQSVAASGVSDTTAGVSAQGTPTPAALCTGEGKSKTKGKSPFAQCVSGLGKLARGKAKNPATACKDLSRKKTKGTAGKSPFATCVKAAAKLMAAKARKPAAGTNSLDSSPSSGSGKSKGKGQDSSAKDDGTDSADDGLVCTDADGNNVASDSPDVEECDDPSAGSGDTSASDSSSSDSADETDTSADETP